MTGTRRIDSFEPRQASRGDPIASALDMDGQSLKDRVQAELNAKSMTWTALQKAANASQKTINQLRYNTNPSHTWQPHTLWKFDDVFELKRGTLHKVWETEPNPAVDEISAQMRLLESRLEEMQQRPPWAAEAIAVLAQLAPEDRAMVVAFARRLAALTDPSGGSQLALMPPRR